MLLRLLRSRRDERAHVAGERDVCSDVERDCALRPRRSRRTDARWSDRDRGRGPRRPPSRASRAIAVAPSMSAMVRATRSTLPYARAERPRRSTACASTLRALRVELADALDVALREMRVRLRRDLAGVGSARAGSRAPSRRARERPRSTRRPTRTASSRTSTRGRTTCRSSRSSERPLSRRR